ncbi:hypothetical protein QOT17_010494 [Balamuthia mandrillaris]
MHGILVVCAKNQKEAQNLTQWTMNFIPSPKTVASLLIGTPGENFRVGEPSKEKELDKIHVFVVHEGMTKLTDRRRLLMDKNATLRQERSRMEAELGRPLVHEVMTDHQNYRFAEEVLDQPLWHFSTKGYLRVAFVYHHLERLTKAGEEALEKFRGQMPTSWSLRKARL